MYRISSKSTHFLTRILPWILSLGIVIFLILFMCNKKLDFLIAFIFLFLLYLLIWWFFTKKLQIVYLGDKKLKINDEIIPFNKIISVNKFLLSAAYRIKYKNGEKTTSFIFLPKFYIPFFTHSYIKEIKNDIKARRNNLNGI